MNKIHIYLLLILATMFCTGVYAQEQTWEAKIDEAKSSLESNPSDTVTRTALAYYYMINNQALLGLREYRAVVEADSTNMDAQAGILWALNSMKQYRTVNKLSHDLLQTYPDNALIHIHTAYAYLNRSSLSQARYHYLRAADNSGFDMLSRQIALEGLGWSYLLLDNSALSLRYYQKAQSLQPDNVISGLSQLNSLRMATDFSYSVPSSQKRAFRVSQSFEHRTWKSDIAIEEFQIKNEHFRTGYMANLYKQFSVLETGLHYSHINGKDSRVYPITNLGVSITPELYTEDIALKLNNNLSYAHYLRFNGYQYSFSPSVRYGKWKGAYSYSYHYQDNESVDADSSKSIQRAQISRVIYKSSELGIYAGLGDLAWSIDSFLNLTDDFNANQKYIGCSVFVPLGEMVELTQYNEWGYSADWHYLFYLKLAIRYQ